MIITQQDESVLGYLINWKVGDGANYNVTIASLPIPGTMTKAVTKDEGDTLWFNETIDLTIQKQSVDVQIDKTRRQNPERARQRPRTDHRQHSSDRHLPGLHLCDRSCRHLQGDPHRREDHAQGQDVQMEEWANPKDTCMDGSIKIDHDHSRSNDHDGNDLVQKELSLSI